MTTAMPRVLLVEPQFVLRRTLAAVARDLGLADVDEAATLGAAERAAQARPYDVIVLSSEAAPDAADALARLVAAAHATRAVLLLAPAHPEPSIPHAVLRKPVNIRALVKLLESEPQVGKPVPRFS